MKTIRILVVDDHVIVRRGLRQLLELEPDIQIVGEAENGLQCLELIDDCKPDVILLDVRMPGLNGVEVARLIKERHGGIKTIILTMYDDEDLVAQAIRYGADGFMLKDVGPDELVKAVRTVAAGKAYLDPGVTASVFARYQKSSPKLKGARTPRLTQRELEILNGLAAGHNNRTISESMHISEHTVRTHLKNIYRKMNVSSRLQAVTKAMDLNLIVPST